MSKKQQRDTETSSQRRAAANDKTRKRGNRDGDLTEGDEGIDDPPGVHWSDRS